MILVDTSVMIDRIRRRDRKLHALFDSLTMATCGLVRAEVLTGARNSTDRSFLLGMLNLRPTLPIFDADWDTFGDFRSTLVSRGLSLSLPDVAIAGVAILFDIELWSRDNAHRLMQGVFPNLRLFVEPP